MKWLYPSIYYQIFKYLSWIRKRSDWRVVAFSAIMLKSFCIAIILDALFRIIENSGGFNYTKTHGYLILVVLMILNTYMVFSNPGIERIKKVSESMSAAWSRVIKILAIITLGIPLTIIVKMFLR